MLLRHFLRTQIHRPRIKISTPTPRTFISDGSRIGEFPTPSPSNDASTAATTTTTETGFDQTPKPLTCVKMSDHRTLSKPASKKPGVVTGDVAPPDELSSILKILKSRSPGEIEKEVIAQLRKHDGNGPRTWTPFLRQDVLHVLSLPTLTAMLVSLNRRKGHLTEDILGCLVQRVSTPDQTGDIEKILGELYRHVIEKVDLLCPIEVHSVSYTPPKIIRTVFLYLHSLLRVDQERAVKICHNLVHMGYIPSASVVDSTSSQTLEQILDLSIVKASLYWNWKDLADTILLSFLQRSSNPDSFIIRHAIDFLYTSMSSATTNGLRRCLKIIRILHPHSPLPDSLVRHFYQSAVEVNAMEVAEELYNFSKIPSILAAHDYPAPQGRALSMLMLHLAGKGRTHLVRTLASDVLEGRIVIPHDDRAEFIRVIAEQGVASSARALWEIYANGVDGPLIYGHSGLMMRMVSLFTRLAERLESLRDLNNSKTAAEMRSFVRHVTSTFKEQHEPWETADHRAMTSYARACFIIGENGEGFDIFRRILERREMPDLHDINVALGAIAECAPKAAVRLIEKMEGRNVAPDVVSYATVLHHASLHKCDDIVEDMTRRLLQTKELYTNVGAFGGVVRAIVKPHQKESQEILRNQLQNVAELVRQFTERGGQTSTQIGNYLVSLAIEAEDPSLAFAFWKALLKGSAEFDDMQQRGHRGAIARLTQAQTMRGEISAPYARMVMSELNKRNT